MGLFKLNMKKSMIVLSLAVVYIPIAIILYNKHTVGSDFLTWSLIIALAVIAIVGYKEYKSKTFEGVFRIKNKHIGYTQAISMWKDRWEYENGIKLRRIIPYAMPFLHPELGDQTVKAKVFPETGASFVTFIPLERGKEAILNLDTPIIYDGSGKMKTKDVDQFATKSRMDVVGMAMKSIPIEERAEVFKAGLTSASNGESKEDVKEEVKSSKD